MIIPRYFPRSPINIFRATKYKVSSSPFGLRPIMTIIPYGKEGWLRKIAPREYMKEV
jgi:hypothetical protein